jgi:SRSO17 transposase
MEASFSVCGADMGASSIDSSDQRFAAYAEDLAGSFGHADRHEPMRDYCLGLLMPIERKSVEPMAAVMAPAEVAAKHQHQPISVKALALGLPPKEWQTITWREGAADKLTSRFARLRVRPAHRDNLLTEPRAEEWLMIEWPEDENEPTKYWLSTLPEEITFDDFVDTAKLRWRIERDYQDLKQELGLGHYEGRGWRGFHHHATLCIAAYGFLISERSAFPPSGPSSSSHVQKPVIPSGYRPRGSASAAGTAHTQLNRDHAPETRHRHHQGNTTMSML